MHFNVEVKSGGRQSKQISSFIHPLVGVASLSSVASSSKEPAPINQTSKPKEHSASAQSPRPQYLNPTLKSLFKGIANQPSPNKYVILKTKEYVNRTIVPRKAPSHSLSKLGAPAAAPVASTTASVPKLHAQGSEPGTAQKHSGYVARGPGV